MICVDDMTHNYRHIQRPKTSRQFGVWYLARVSSSTCYTRVETLCHTKWDLGPFWLGYGFTVRATQRRQYTVAPRRKDEPTHRNGGIEVTRSLAVPLPSLGVPLQPSFLSSSTFSAFFREKQTIATRIFLPPRSLVADSEFCQMKLLYPLQETMRVCEATLIALFFIRTYVA